MILMHTMIDDVNGTVFIAFVYFAKNYDEPRPPGEF